MAYTIRNDYYPALRQSGFRRLSLIELFVLHSIESGNLDGAAEGAGAWFQNSKVKASSHYGIDNDSIQRYLKLTQIAWGAPGANQSGVHYEQMGYARWTREQWMDKARPTLDRTAWLMARNHNYLKSNGVTVPLRKLSDDELADRKPGITSHRQVTRVFGGGTHTDPGTGYPYEWVVERARYYAAK